MGLTARTRLCLLVSVLVAGIAGCGSTVDDPELVDADAAATGSEAEASADADADPDDGGATEEEGATDEEDATDDAATEADETGDDGPSAPGEIVGRFDVGGHELFIRCVGTGSPTIVYLHGAVQERGYSPHGNGSYTADRLGDEYRVCAYDRRNVGSSESVDAEQRPEDVVSDLHNLLAAAEVDPPYVLLGASFGGVLAYNYLNNYPDDVIGMVLLDSMFVDELAIDDLFPEEEQYVTLSEEDACCTPERISHYEMLRAGEEFIGDEPAIPVTYFYSLREPREYGIPEYDDVILDVLAAYVDRFEPGELIMADAPHYMEPAIPDEIADALRDVIAKAGH
jgi:pimeloyl-ACP methyl ester carboxylesterase